MPNKQPKRFTYDEPFEISAEYGEFYICRVFYFDGEKTLHGPFADEEEATVWGDTYLEIDYKDVKDYDILVINKVR